MMQQCETCIDCEHKEDLLQCRCAELAYNLREAIRLMPFIGKYMEEYRCKQYEMDSVYKDLLINTMWDDPA